MEVKRKTKQDVSEQKKKKFLGTVTFDSLTNNHGRIKRIFKLLNKERYYLPMSVPDVKLKQYIFSLRKMKRKLGIQWFCFSEKMSCFLWLVSNTVTHVFFFPIVLSLKDWFKGCFFLSLLRSYFLIRSNPESRVSILGSRFRMAFYWDWFSIPYGFGFSELSI